MTDAERSEPSEFPPRLQLLMRISGWSALVWGVGVFPYAALQVNGSTATWATYARIASTLIVWTSMLLTLGLAPIILVWTHRLTGQWPWDGYTITSAIRESAGAIGLMEHHGRPASGQAAGIVSSSSCSSC